LQELFVDISNLSGGTLSTSGTFIIGNNGGSNGTLNIGTGSTAGAFNAAVALTSGQGTGTVNFNHTGSYTFAPQLTGNLSMNQIGGASLDFHQSKVTVSFVTEADRLWL